MKRIATILALFIILIISIGKAADYTENFTFVFWSEQYPDSTGKFTAFSRVEPKSVLTATPEKFHKWLMSLDTTLVRILGVKDSTLVNKVTEPTRTK